MATLSSSGMAFVVPDRELWEQGYAAEAGRSLLDITLILDEGLAVATPFITPLRWEPKGGRWLG